MPDVMEKLGRSLIQHGKDSDRVYLMKLDPNDVATIVAQIEGLAEANDYGKLFCKVPGPAVESFAQAGYQEEARIPDFFDGRTDVAFMSRFRKAGRGRVTDEQRAAIDRALEIAEQKRGACSTNPENKYRLRLLDEADTPALAALYRTVFPSYPFPIFDQAYLRETMATHVRYFGAFDGDRLIAASSAEMDAEARNAEMTDFADCAETSRPGAGGCATVGDGGGPAHARVCDLVHDCPGRLGRDECHLCPLRLSLRRHPHQQHANLRRHRIDERLVQESPRLRLTPAADLNQPVTQTVYRVVEWIESARAADPGE